jgi:hypothetical protein
MLHDPYQVWAKSTWYQRSSNPTSASGQPCEKEQRNQKEAGAEENQDYKGRKVK